MKEKVLVFRGGQGIGDMLIATPVIRLLAEAGCEVHVAPRGGQVQVVANNPHIAKFHEPPANEGPDELFEYFSKSMDEVDRVVDLAFTIEKAYLHRVDQIWGEIPSLEDRRAAAAGQNYYDENLRKAGLEPRPVLPELYPLPKEQENLDKIALDKLENGWKMVIWNTMGSTINKFMVKCGRWITAVHDRLPNTRHFLSAHFPVEIPSLPRGSKRIFQTEGFWQLRDALLMTSIADLVVGPESASVNAAACYSTPKVICYSHSTPDNLGRYYQNHYPIIPKCDCSPCYLIPLNFTGYWHWQERLQILEATKPCLVKNPNYFDIKGFKCVWDIDDEELIETCVSILEKGQAKPAALKVASA